MKNEATEKRSYEPPRLTQWGKVEVVTQADVSLQSVDGTVYPDVRN